MGHGIRFVLLGLALGLAMAVAVTRLLSTMLFGLAPVDIATFGQVVLVVAWCQRSPVPYRQRVWRDSS